MLSFSHLAAPVQTRRVLFTGSTIHEVAASRTAITAVPPRGAILIRDPFAHEGQVAGNNLGGATAINGVAAGGQGRDSVCYTRPQASFLHLQKVVVVNVEAPQDGTRLRYCDVVDVAEAIQALVDLSSQALAVGDFLVPVAGQYHLALAPITSVAEVATILRNSAGIALETVPSGTSNALRVIKLGGPFNHGN